jgi:hypothetical protein
MSDTDQPPPDAGGRELTMNVKIDLNGISGRVSRDLKRIILLASAGLQSVDKVDTDNLTLPVGMKIQIQQDLPIVRDELIEEFGEWILACGLRDAIEAVSAAIEEAHNVLSIWQVTNFQHKQTKISGTEWRNVVVDGARDFHRFGLPIKLRHFIDKHGVALASNMVAHVISINTARNCLVHRAGIVTNEDVTTGGVLKVTWRAADFFIETESGDKPLVVNQVVEEGGMLSIRFFDTEKIFQFGERIRFTAAEFSEMCWTSILFAIHVGEKMTELGIARGALQNPELPAQSNPAP